MEGIVRDLSSIGGLVISANERDRLGRGVTRLRYIHDLLWDEKFSRLLPAEALEFVRWLLIEQGGINLRNEVAHSDLELEQYNEFLSHWLFLALLRLVRVDVEKSASET